MTKIKLPSNEFILYALGTAQTLGMARVSYAYAIDGDWLVKSLAITGGLLTGFAVSFTLAILAQGLPRVWQTKRRRILALCSGGVLLVIVPIYMAPAIFLGMAHITPHELRIITSIALALAPDAAALTVAVMSGTLQAVEATQSQPDAKPKRTKPAFVCSCGFEATSQAALNGHKLKHKPKKPKFDVDAALKPFEDRSA